MLIHDETPAAVEARDAAFVLGTYARTSFHPRSGKGARIVDADGHEYWDLLGGIAVNALGHRHPRLVKALRDESNALLHLSNLYYHPAQGLLAEKLVRASGLLRAFFCNSGTEANEAALKFARLANPGRSVLVALNESFHGRTGTLFAFQQSGIVPDIITLAKPLGGGLPLGAVLTGPAMEGLVKPGHHGTTFGGNPVACRLGLAVLEEIEASSLLAKVTTLGEWFGGQLRALQSRMPVIVDVRGMGMMWGIELDRPAKPVVAELLARGFVCGTARENVIRLLPPYIVPKKALSEFIAALENVLASISSKEKAA